MSSTAEPRLLILETSGRAGKVGLAEGRSLKGVRLLDETRSTQPLRLVESRPVGPDGVVLLIYGPKGDDD